MITISGTLILNGNLTSNEGIEITSTGIVIPVPDVETKNSFFSYQSNSYIWSNGQGRCLTSTTGNIRLDGLIDGRLQGFTSNQGPGANSILIDSSGNILQGYGATHAGLGALFNPINSIPPPKSPYGFRESPVSLGSGGGFYTADSSSIFTFGEYVIGGGAIKIVAPSGSIRIDGDIIMDGQSSIHAGGAAGGSVWLVGWDVTGDGMISANGGTTLAPINAGGGGGGYISVWYEKSYSFSGTMSVTGQSDGKVFIKQIEPFFEEPFSGTILNQKWWASDSTPNNGIQLISQNYISSATTSIFGISGKNIVIDADYFSVGNEAGQYEIQFVLWADPYNWVGLARRKTGLFGISSSGGVTSASGIPFPYEDLTFRIMKNDSTFSFQYYDTTSSPLTIYTDVLPGLANLDFKVMVEVDKFPQSTFLVDQLRLTPLDIENGYLQLSAVPSDQTAVALNIINGSPQIYGTDFTVSGNHLCWESPLQTFLDVGDILRVVYPWTYDNTSIMQAGFGNVTVYQGVLDNHITQDSVLYVDSDYGSDSNNGTQLKPLQNLFVATAWSQPGGTVVLYDGTYAPTQVRLKDITIRGAEGADPYISSQLALGTTGSGWEVNALNFYKSKGLVYNVQAGNSTNGIRVENSPDFEIAKSTAFGNTNGISFINSDPVVRRSLLYGNSVSIDLISCNNVDINSNVIYDSSVGVNAIQCQDVAVVGNTIDNNTTAVVLGSSTGIVSSNSITSGQVGLQASLDSSVASFSNNYFNLVTSYTRPPDASANDISEDPLYVDEPNHNYHIATGSPNIGAGDSTYDDFFTDYDGVSKIDGSSTIGAFEYLSGNNHTGDFYVEGSGYDFRNLGGINDPFRTLDKALLVADATTHIDGGHYDTYYLNLHNQYVDLNQLFIYTPVINHLVSYKTLLPNNIERGYYYLPGFLVNSRDSSNVALNVIGGPALVYGQEYKVEAGGLMWVWDGTNHITTPEGVPLLAEGDTLRITYLGQMQYKALNALTLHSHYSNLDQSSVIFVSPGGSDSTVLGGDGTNTGGTGSFNLPFRSIDKALGVSSPGTNIVAIAGEYPIFQPLNDRVLVTAIDRTVVTNGQEFLEDDFSPNDFRAFGTALTGPIPWNFTFSGSSYAVSGGGFLSLTYDGNSPVRADSIFQLGGNFNVQATLIDFVGPLQMRITGPDATFFVNYYNQDYTCGSIAGGTYACNGTVDYTALPGLTFITDYVPVSYENIENQYIPLAFLPADCSNIAVNIVGGTAQNFGEDFTIQDGNLTWDSSSSLSDLDAGEILRVIYGMGNNTFAPIRVEMNLTDNRLTTKLFSQGVWKTAYRKDIGDSTGPWIVSFVIDSTGADSVSCLNGRGFVSGFVAIADSITNSNIARPYGNITERKNLVLFSDVPIGIVTGSSLINGYDGTRYRARIDATGGTSDWAWPYSWSWQVTDGTVPPGMLFYDKQSYAWLDGIPTSPGDYTFTVQLNDPGSRDQSVSKDFFLNIE
jgi:hypothetical protein